MVKKAFGRSSKNSEEKEKEKGNRKAFCITRKHKKERQLQNFLRNTQTQLRKFTNVYVKCKWKFNTVRVELGSALGSFILVHYGGVGYSKKWVKRGQVEQKHHINNIFSIHYEKLILPQEKTSRVACWIIRPFLFLFYFSGNTVKNHFCIAEYLTS